MQVLYVGNGNYKDRGAWYYNVSRKLINGFTRNGHNVYLFSDRDTSRSGSIFGARKLGIGYCNRALLDTCWHFAPELVVLGHAYIISNETLLKMRELLPNVRIAQFTVDALFNPHVERELSRMAPLCDATFATTAGDVLKRFGQPKGVASYFPNPVDASIDWPRCHEHSDQPHDVFWAMRTMGTPNPQDPRFVLPHFLQTKGIDIDFHGMSGRPVLNDAAYYRAIAAAKMGLNISSSRHAGGVEAPEAFRYLYSSDRISQYMGSGLLTLSPRGNRLEELFTDGEEVIFFSSAEELLEKVRYYKTHDDERRAIAAAGWQKAHRHLNERVVTQYIVEVTFRLPLSLDYLWPTLTH